MTEKIKCFECGAEIRPQSKFCGQCGAKVPPPPPSRPTHCPNTACGKALAGHEKFCPACGTKIEPTVAAAGVSTVTSQAPKPQKVSCQDCAHYRQAVPISSLLHGGGSKEVSEALVKIKEDETKQRTSEAKQKVELIKIQSTEWGFRPIMSDYCVAKAEANIFEICEIKNKNVDCADFLQQTLDYQRSCQACIHRVEVNPGDQYRVLEGIHDPKIHHGMLEGIESEFALEITSLYHGKGENASAPKFHDWCRYYSTSGKFVALPYPNVHHDCQNHELNPDYKPILGVSAPEKPKMDVTAKSLGAGFPGIRKGEHMGPSKNNRPELIALQSQYMAANRKGNRQAFAAFLTRQLERMRAGQSLPHLLEQFEDWTFITMLTFASTKELKGIAEAVLPLLPERLQPLQKDQDLLVRMMKGAEQNNVFYKLFNTSPYALINVLARELPADKLKEVCQQTIREAFCLERASLETKHQFLAEEKIRIENGMYPENMLHDLKRLLNKMERNLAKLKEEVRKKGAEAVVKGLCCAVSPLSVPEVVDVFTRTAAYLGIPCPFSYEPLTESQQEQLRALMAGDYNLEDMVIFLEGQHQHLTGLITSLFQSVEQEVQYTGGLEFSNLYEFAQVSISYLEPAQRAVTTLLNMLSRRLRPREHSDFQCIQTPFSETIKKVVQRNDPEGAKATYPEHESLYLLQYRLQAQTSAPSSTSEGEKYPPKESAGPQQQGASVEFYVNMGGEKTAVYREGNEMYVTATGFKLPVYRQFDRKILQDEVDQMREMIASNDQEFFGVQDYIFRLRLKVMNKVLNKLDLSEEDFNELDSRVIIRLLAEKGLVR